MIFGENYQAARHASRALEGLVGDFALEALDLVVARQAREIDDAFFSQHPGRSSYARVALNGEFARASRSSDWLTVVRRLESGQYLRCPIYCPNDRELPEMSRDVAACLVLSVDTAFDDTAESAALCGA